MPTLTIFANFRINDYERFLRMKDSFMSFKSINAEKWVINVRGSYNLGTLFFLREHLGEKLFPHTIESGKGWFYDSRQLLEKIDTDYVFFWVEDHINLKDVSIYDEILGEMSASNSEYLNYTWWFLGHSPKVYDGISKTAYNHIESLVLNENNAKNLTLLGRKPYLISIQSIFSTALFKKIINKNDPKLRRWPKETPFDFEKKGTDYHWLPINIAISKTELFASIDDDNGIPGYSLQSRGLYPKRITRFISKPVKRNVIGAIISQLIPLPIKNFIKRCGYHI